MESCWYCAEAYIFHLVLHTCILESQGTAIVKGVISSWNLNRGAHIWAHVCVCVSMIIFIHLWGIHRLIYTIGWRSAYRLAMHFWLTVKNWNLRRRKRAIIIAIQHEMPSILMTFRKTSNHRRKVSTKLVMLITKKINYTYWLIK